MAVLQDRGLQVPQWEGGRGLSDRSLVLVDAIATLLSIGVPPTRYEFVGDFRGTVALRAGGAETERFEVWASATTGCWEVHTRSMKERRVFNPQDGLLMVEGKRREEISISERQSPPTHPAARFAFPLRLPVWGRVPIDQWKMRDASETDHGVLIALEGINDARQTGFLELSESGLPRSLGSDDEQLVLLDAGPLSDLSRFFWRD